MNDTSVGGRTRVDVDRGEVVRFLDIRSGVQGGRVE